MDQSNALSDALSKSSSMLSGLLSQMGGFGSAATQGLFSSLLSQNDESDTAIETQTQISNSAPATAATADTNGVAPQDAGSGQDGSGSTPALLQNLAAISGTLHQILDGLRQQKKAQSQQAGAQNTTASPAASTATPQASADTRSAALSGAFKAITGTEKTATEKTSTGKNSTTDTTAAATPGSADSSSDPAQTLSDIVGELLAMTQMMMKALEQQAKTGTGDAASAATAATTSGNDQNAALASLETNGTLSLGAGLLDFLKDLDLLTSGKNSASAATPAATASPTQAMVATPTGTDTSNPLLQLLQALEKDAQQLLPMTQADTTQTPSSSTAQKTADLLPGDSSDTQDGIAAQFATLDNQLQQIASALQQQLTPASPAQAQIQLQATKSLAVMAQQNAKNAVDDLTASVVTATTDATAKTPSSGDTQTRLSTAADTSSKQAVAAATVAAQQTSAASSATPTATADPSIAIVAGGKSDSGDTTPDFTSDDHAPSFANNNSAANASLNAEGMQATGTYNFASTLSAVRATQGGSTGLPSVVDQVILQMNRSVKDGNSEMSLQLHPADLGKITVKLDMSSDGKVSGTVTAENPHTLAMLQKDSRSLERALQDAGLRADPGSLQFNLGTRQDQNQTGQTNQNAADSTGENESDGTQNASDNLSPVDISTLPEVYYVTPTGVNIRV